MITQLTWAFDCPQVMQDRSASPAMLKAFLRQAFEAFVKGRRILEQCRGRDNVSCVDARKRAAEAMMALNANVLSSLSIKVEERRRSKLPG